MRDEVQDQAAFWDSRYSDERYIFGTRPNTFLVSRFDGLGPGLRVLAPGDGEGRNSVWLARQGHIVDAVDVSGKGIAKARTLAAEAGVAVNFTQADLVAWEWPRAAYDAVAALYLHFHDDDRARMHRAMLDALKPGGALILEAFSTRQLALQQQFHSGGPRTADLLYSTEKLAADFSGATIEMMEEAEVELDEGHRHKGRAAVVRCLVRNP